MLLYVLHYSNDKSVNRYCVYLATNEAIIKIDNNIEYIIADNLQKKLKFNLIHLMY